MNTGTAASVNVQAVSAVIALFLLVAVFFGSPVGSRPAESTGVVSIAEHQE